ncbi:hypothetical protein B0H21DRAFT_698962 [Amylocystis lapponica]|nr:hypothetical protein B0H21DRAFT_698962 [Amylocystis lapponica]
MEVLVTVNTVYEFPVSVPSTGDAQRAAASQTVTPSDAKATAKHASGASHSLQHTEVPSSEALWRYRDELIAEFFGGRPKSKRDARPKVQKSVVVKEKPGSAGADMQRAEPATLAKRLFFLGFLFFPFWIAGALVLFLPLEATPDEEAGKCDDDERDHTLCARRAAEIKWAERCLWAALVFLVVSAAMAIILLPALTLH